MKEIEKQFVVPKAVIKEFFNIDNILSIRPYGNGHINSTYLIEFPSCKYILQRINNDVFENPFGVMHNLELVTDYIRKKIIYEGKDPRVCVLTTVLTRYGQDMAIVDDDYWRCMRFIEEGETYDYTDSAEIFREVGVAVGDFQKNLQGFHTRVLVDTIKHFHDTPYRYEHFKDIVKIDRMKRCSLCKEEIDFVHSQASKLGIITTLIDKKVIPRRVTHNDTKLNNIMISKTTGKALGLIDFDTVMKGSLLYDYGDALRLGCSTAEEDERDLNKININFDLFRAFNEGYLSEVKEIIEEEEIKHLIDGYFLMTFEVGMRFLTDFIDGDHYFVLKPKDKVKRPYLNYERAKNQLYLANLILKDYDKLVDIMNETLLKLGYQYKI